MRHVLSGWTAAYEPRTIADAILDLICVRRRPLHLLRYSTVVHYPLMMIWESWPGRMNLTLKIKFKTKIEILFIIRRAVSQPCLRVCRVAAWRRTLKDAYGAIHSRVVVVCPVIRAVGAEMIIVLKAIPKFPTIV